MWMSTLVRLVARVRPDVLLQMTQLGELALTNLAAVRFDAQVDARVLRQVRAVGERLGALRAFVRLGLAHVDLRVELEVCLGAKNLHKTTRESGPVDRPIDQERERERDD